MNQATRKLLLLLFDDYSRLDSSEPSGSNNERTIQSFLAEDVGFSYLSLFYRLHFSSIYKYIYINI